jgi:hypothetical protein
MKDLLIIALNCNEDFEFEGCDFHNDKEYSNNLNYFTKLNRIGFNIREIEIKNSKTYKLICFIDSLKYNISKFPKDWLYEFSIKNSLSAKDLYSDEVKIDVDMWTSRLSYSLVITNSISFNFISNFYRFEKELEQLTNTKNTNLSFYTFCVHQKLRLINYKVDNRKETKLI